MNIIVPKKQNRYWQKVSERAMALWQEHSMDQVRKKNGIKTKPLYFPEDEAFFSMSLKEAKSFLEKSEIADINEMVNKVLNTRVAIELWHEYSEEYQTILQDYRENFQKTRRLKPIPEGIKKTFLDTFPEIPWLRLSEEEALLALKGKTSAEIKRIINQVMEYKDSKLRERLRDFNRSAKLRLGWKEAPKGNLNPEACKINGFRKSARIYGDDLSINDGRQFRTQW